MSSVLGENPTEIRCSNHAFVFNQLPTSLYLPWGVLEGESKEKTSTARQIREGSHLVLGASTYTSQEFVNVDG